MTSFVWRLPELMAQNKLTDTSALRPLLAVRGVELSREQVFRLVKRPPERLSMRTLVALCAIFNCTPNDLIQLPDVLASPPPPGRAAKARQAPFGVRRVKLR